MNTQMICPVIDENATNPYPTSFTGKWLNKLHRKQRYVHGEKLSNFLVTFLQNRHALSVLDNDGG